MPFLAAAVCGAIAGIFIESWMGLLVFSIGGAAFLGVKAAIKGPEWRPFVPSDDPEERARHERLTAEELERYGSIQQYGRVELFFLEFIWCGLICFGSGAIVIFIVG